MYYRKSAGGWNRSHGTVEKTPRIDSFDLPDGWGYALCGGQCMETYRDADTLTVFTRSDEIELKLSHSRNGYGGQQSFFVCPVCGGRHRYLYQAVSGFVCRKCARLNYVSQQQNHDSMVDYHKGMEYAESRLAVHPIFRPDGFGFSAYIPDRPRGMHHTTYKKRLVRFSRYRQRYAERLAMDIAHIMKGVGT